MLRPEVTMRTYLLIAYYASLMKPDRRRLGDGGQVQAVSVILMGKRAQEAHKKANQSGSTLLQ